jgi:hypothetical protein
VTISGENLPPGSSPDVIGPENALDLFSEKDYSERIMEVQGRQDFVPGGGLENESQHKQPHLDQSRPEGWFDHT